MSNLVIKSKSLSQLHRMNESDAATGEKRYVFEGPFTVCDVKNRNERIYDEEEVLKHLSYLREKIKKEGCILGELDHPEGRFEVYLNDVSHKITDLWYVPETKTVMGRLELLNTQKGQTMKAIVDAGCPLYVSSRAAGTVGPNSHVSIQQIFTYDIVATPGFEQCRLEAVSEAMRADVKSFLNESMAANEAADAKGFNKAFSLGLDTKRFSVFEGEISETRRNEIETVSKKIASESVNMTNLTTPLSEDIQVKVSPEKAEELGLRLSDAKGSNDDGGSEHDASDILDIIPTYAEQENAGEIEDIQPEFNSADQNSVGDEGQTETKMDENPFMTESKSCGGKKPCGGKKESKKEEYSEDKDLDEKKEGKSCCGKSCCEEEEAVDECGTLAELKKQKNAVKESSAKDMEYYEGILEAQRTKTRVREAIIAKYPFSAALSEHRFAKFAQLSEEEKMECAKFIYENQILDAKTINEQFMRPLFQQINARKNYIRLADSSDLELYNMAPAALRESIDKMAELFVLENKSDVDEFWARTGIRDLAKRTVSNEQFVRSYNEQIAMSEDANQGEMEFINVIGRYMRQ